MLDHANGSEPLTIRDVRQPRFDKWLVVCRLRRVRGSLVCIRDVDWTERTLDGGTKLTFDHLMLRRFRASNGAATRRAPAFLGHGHGARDVTRDTPVTVTTSLLLPIPPTVTPSTTMQTYENAEEDPLMTEDVDMHDMPPESSDAEDMASEPDDEPERDAPQEPAPASPAAPSEGPVPLAEGEKKKKAKRAPQEVVRYAGKSVFPVSRVQKILKADKVRPHAFGQLCIDVWSRNYQWSRRRLSF